MSMVTVTCTSSTVLLMFLWAQTVLSSFHILFCVSQKHLRMLSLPLFYKWRNSYVPELQKQKVSRANTQTSFSSTTDSELYHFDSLKQRRLRKHETYISVPFPEFSWWCAVVWVWWFWQFTDSCGFAGKAFGKGWNGGRGVSLVLKLLSFSTDKIAFLCIFKSKRLKIV